MSRSAVVTGCGRGIGRAILERLVADGWHVVGIELDEEAAREAGSEVVVGDVADRGILEEAAARAIRAAPLAGWVNNAAIGRLGNLHEPDAAEVERMLAVDLHAVFWGCSTAVRTFVSQCSGGAIVNISSTHGRLGFSGWAAYDTAKGGVDSLTRYVAVEYGPVGIRANAIAPGAVRTEMHRRFLSTTPDPAAAEREMAAVAPLRRIAEPREIAAVAAFLLSDEASYLTGQSVAVDGGTSVAGGVFPLDPALAAAYGLEQR